MWVEDEEWNSFMTHLFYVGYIRKFLLLFSPGCFFRIWKKRGGGGLGAGPQVFCWYAKANLGRFLK